MINDLMKIILPYKEICTSSLKPEQKICVEFSNHMRALTLEGRLPYIWYHIPNEFLPSTRKNFSFDLKQKHMGKISGVPDYCFVGSKNSFFIEFKAGKGKMSPPQKIFKDWCEEKRVGYYLCYSALEAIQIVMNNGGCSSVSGAVRL